MTPLPIDAQLPEIERLVRTSRRLFLAAEPGSGKTTRVPPHLAAALGGKVLVLEPRRLAARLAAQRVAAEAADPLGERYGYRVRFEGAESTRTQVLYVTEGLFLPMLRENPDLSGYAALVLDEFHERRIAADTALALARRLQRGRRPDLRLVVMSATLDVEDLAERAEGIAFRSGGTVHPVRVDYPEAVSDRPLAQRLARAVTELAADPACPGHILAFLPGIAEIRRAGEALRAWADSAGVTVHELWADLPAEAQRAVFAPSRGRKVILATNVAETSVTVDGVTGVVDSGLARIPGYALWSGIPTLEVRPVSRASAIQRAGRAGRTAPGVVRRLYTRRDFEARQEAERPEILRLDLAQLVLELQAVAPLMNTGGSSDLEALPWLDPPPPERWEAGADLLRRLEALDAEGALTALGRDLLHLPLHPRLARVVAEGQRRSCPAALPAALLVGEGMLRRRGVPAEAVASSDVDHELALLRGHLERPRAEAKGLDLFRVARVVEGVRRLAPGLGWTFARCLAEGAENVLAACFLAGFPDRVASVRRREWGRGRADDRVELQLCVGGGATLSPESVARDEDWLIAVNAEDLPAVSASASARIRTAVGVSPELLVDSGRAWVRELEEVVWNAEAQRAEGRRSLNYGALTLESTRLRDASPALSAVLSRALRQAWPKPYPDDAPLREYAGRRRFLLSLGQDLGLPDLAGEAFENLLYKLCAGRNTFAQIAARPLAQSLSELLDPVAAARLDELAPETVKIGTGRRVPVHYTEGASPWIAARIQDFFGSVRPPRIGGGKVALTLHLLAPNQRPVQVTTDLDGFWDRAYPELRRRLARRYPKHAWPEDPRGAAPPPRKK